MAILLNRPPTTKTLPSDNNVAVCEERGMDKLPGISQVPVAGLYSSAVSVLTGLFRLPIYPPATRTFPLDNNVAVCLDRGTISGLERTHKSDSNKVSSEVLIKVERFSIRFELDEDNLITSSSFWHPEVIQEVTSR